MKLAEKGYPLAECQIGYFYYEGLGVDKDFKKSFYWTQRAAEHGDRDAQNNLAELFYGAGVVVEKDIGKAKEWYKKAADNGHKEALEKYRALGVEAD
ncbi:MAG TPA: tetratricopeptide repeat protein [Clostridia bacterium]|nr:tetratricopeptide repeat protein [Clostridia bacterium]